MNQTGRATKGVKLINLKKKEQIQAVDAYYTFATSVN
ncbi:hypothetical protein [Mycoplasmopsis bovis]